MLIIFVFFYYWVQQLYILLWTRRINILTFICFINLKVIIIIFKWIIFFSVYYFLMKAFGNLCRRYLTIYFCRRIFDLQQYLKLLQYNYWTNSYSFLYCCFFYPLNFLSDYHYVMFCIYIKNIWLSVYITESMSIK